MGIDDELRIVNPDMTYHHILFPWRTELYTPERHNLMVAALGMQGITGDLDAFVQAYANVHPDMARVILKKARALRDAPVR